MDCHYATQLAFEREYATRGGLGEWDVFEAAQLEIFDKATSKSGTIRLEAVSL